MKNKTSTFVESIIDKIHIPVFLVDCDLKITAINNKAAYAPDDTVIVALKCKIPNKFHLYSNPLGPGTGKPLSIKLNNSSGITWIGVKKQTPDKFHPPIGEWV